MYFFKNSKFVNEEVGYKREENSPNLSNHREMDTAKPVSSVATYLLQNGEKTVSMSLTILNYSN